jgi:hypothetical protein
VNSPSANDDGNIFWNLFNTAASTSLSSIAAPLRGCVSRAERIASFESILGSQLSSSEILQNY